MANPSLQSSSATTPPDGEPSPTNRGVTVLRIIRQYIDKNISLTLWTTLGATVFVSVLCDRIFMSSGQLVREYPFTLLYYQRTAAVFACLLFPRLADVHSRAASGMLALMLFLLGSIIASVRATEVNNTEPAYVAGVTLHALGASGLSSLVKLTIADYTSLRWRALALSSIDLSGLPVVWLNVPIWKNISPGWVFGMFGIIVLVVFTPPIVFLHFIALKHREEIPRSDVSITRRILDGLVKMDPLGLLFFTVGFGLIDFNMDTFWRFQNTPGAVPMAVVGFILVLPVFILWELSGPRSPLMPRWIFRNRAVLCGVTVTFCSRIVTVFSGNMTNSQPPFWWTPRPVLDLYETVWWMSRGISGPIFGCIIFLARRYRHTLMYTSSALIGAHVLGLSGAISDTIDFSRNIMFLWIFFQLLVGVNQSAVDLAAAVGSQASIPHNDLSTLIGFTEALAKLGIMLSTRSGWQRTHIIALAALNIGFASLCVVACHFMPAYVLADDHNVVEGKDGATLDDAAVTGEALGATAEVTNALVSFVPQE